MLCKHKFKIVNTISRQSHKKGSKKFKSGFEVADLRGVKILVARQKQCIKCEKKETTIEISQDQFDDLLNKLPSKLKSKSNKEVLSSIEKRVRKYLIKVSKGKIKTRHENRAMYKEVWNQIYPERQFGRGNTNEVVGWIVNISNIDTRNGKPPLNSLVIRGDTGMPGESWEEWRLDSNTKFKSISKAQQACWSYWQ